jgi:hypothetical protein
MLPAAIAGIGVMVWLWSPVRFEILHGINDFENLYAGARLIGTPGQFDPAAYRDLQMAAAGHTNPSWLFTRLPAFALPLRPLGWLPYRAAYGVWQAMSVAALGAFLLLWRTKHRGLLAVACCWSFPLSEALAKGQDDTFLLLWIALAVRCAAASPAIAGAFLALGSMKYQLFLLVPLALAAGRLWRVLKGFAVTAAIIFALCFAAAGPGWIGGYAQMVLNPAVSPNADVMPNLHGLFAGWSFANVAEAAAAVFTAGAVWYIARRSDFQFGLAAAIIGSILVSHHAYNSDLVLLIPAAWILFGSMAGHAMENAAVLLVPTWMTLPVLNAGPVVLRPVPLFMIAMIVALVIYRGRSWRRERDSDGQSIDELSADR